MTRALPFAGLFVASFAAFVAFACGTVPDPPKFVADCQYNDVCEPDGGDDSAPGDVGDAGMGDGDPDGAPNTCPGAPPVGATLCCGAVPCVSANANKKHCSDDCEQCEQSCAGLVCCVDLQGTARCGSSSSPLGCF